MPRRPERPSRPTPSPRPPARPATGARDARDGREPRPTPRREVEVVDDAEHKVAGENACRALFTMRPDDIRRVYVTEAVLPRFKDVLKFCAERRLAYHVKTDEDLDQVAETVHHDGVLFLARRQKDARLDELLAWAERLKPGQRSLIVLLENVKNPHNLGAILRVCAHFGVPWVVRAGQTPALSPAAMRTAEGGAEHCRVIGADAPADLEAALARLQRLGFALLATSSHATLALGREALPERAVVMFGSEGEGLTPALMKRADDVIAIPGSGALESLNVACAASVVLWELWRGAADARAPLPRRSAPVTTTMTMTPTSTSTSSTTARPVKGAAGPHDDRRGRSTPRRGGPRG
jgi:TrmH RNA methyltransferase